MWVLLALGVLANASRVLSSGYCSQNTFPTNTSWMHFTKEPVPFEYGFQDNIKSIHCCVKGYRSIEWFKDGVAYPWSAGVSNLILYPEAANQTLYTRRATRADSGNYTCRLSNETHSETHTVELDILEKATDAPKTMFISKDQWVEEGSAVRLFCEALIASSYLADARSDLRWWKVFPNGTDGELLSSQNEIRTKRDDVEDIIGSYLSIERVSAADYGTYACVVHSNDVVSRSYVTVHYKHGGVGGWEESGGVPWRAVAACGASVVLAGVLLAAAHRRYTPRLLLAARHARARAAGAAQRARVLEKEFDVLVCSTAVDAELVRGALLPTLALKYKYRVLARTLSNNPDNWYKEIVCEVGRCRSVVGVVSPAQHTPAQLLTALRQLRALPLPPVVVLLQVNSATGYKEIVCEVGRCRSVVGVVSPAQHTPAQLLTALRQLRALPLPPVVVLLQDLPKLKREAKESGESLVSVLRRTRLVAWRHVHERAFWTALRLALPLPPPPPPQPAREEKTEVEETRNPNSGSMTALV